MDGRSLRDLRRKLRRSQGDLADDLSRRLGGGVDRARVSRWESGREPVPAEVARDLQALAGPGSRTARTLVFANQKGGVGKTTSALNVAYGLAAAGGRVLVIDMDPQATATIALLAAGSVAAYRERRTIGHVILGERALPDVVIPAERGFEGRVLPFDLAASHIDLAETDSRREPGFDAALREAVEPVRAEYDWIVVDAPPNLGMLTWMALAAAEDVIVPVRTEPYDTMGVGLILGTINKVQRRLNPSLRLAGILPTQYGSRKSVDREVLEHLAAAMGGKAPVLEPVPDSAVFGHAARNGRIALEASPGAAATAAYARLVAALFRGTPLPLADVPASGPARAEA